MKKTFILVAIVFVCLFGLQADAQVSHSSAPAIAIDTNNCLGDDGGDGVDGWSDTIAFAEAGTISDVDVTVEIDHTWRSDLQFHVEYSVGAAGAIILAADHGSSSGDNYYATFDDEAATLCDDASMCGGDNVTCTDAGTAVTCQPDMALSAFDALTSPGTWTMFLCDDAGGDFGTWNTWTVTVDGDGDLPVELMSFMVE
ncbi:MAG: hypothetical protein DRJ65_18075 [Acidobacteria bacterium]|nr:MAG: hypothetical protein DRJ65_18075 [Acidobacteriota bacterium]